MRKAEYRSTKILKAKMPKIHHFIFVKIKRYVKKNTF